MEISGDMGVVVSGSSMMNGELLEIGAEGRASLEKGTVGISWEWSRVPEGAPMLISIASTSAGISPAFAREEDGGQSLMTISRGRYRLERSFDYGRFGRYYLDFEIRTHDDYVTSTGVQRGVLHLPPIEGAHTSLVEVLYPVGPREIRTFMKTALIDTDGNDVPVLVTGRYSPLEDDEDWATNVPPQVRRSEVEIEGGDKRIAILYSTSISGIR